MRVVVACLRCGFFALLAVAAVVTSGRAEPPDIRWVGKIEVAAGGGHRGPWRMNESDYDYVDDPTVAIDARGAIAVAWVDQSQKDIFFQAFEPDGRERLAAPVNVSRSPRIFSWLPRLLVIDDAVYILWQEIVFSGGSHGGEILFARSTDGGASFGEPVNLSRSIEGDGKGRLTARYWDNGSLDLAMGPDGRLYAAWTDYDGTLWLSRSADRGASFSAPSRVAGSFEAPARGPALAVGADGAVHLAWTLGEDRAADIRFATSTDQARSFGAPRLVGESDGHADAPKVAVDGTGTVHLVYAESPAGSFGRYHIRYTRLRPGAPAFETPREIAVPPSAEAAGADFPTLSLDGRDYLYLVWELFPRPGGRSRGLGFSFSQDGGRTFAPSSLVPGSADPAFGVNGSQQGLLMRKLAVNRTGALAVVNSTFKTGETSRIWLFRAQAGGG